jgi:hypothetical protein
VDIVGWQRFGMALAVEVKTEDGQLTDEQFEFLRDVKERGGFAGVYAPSGLYEFSNIPVRFLPANKRVKR